MQRSAEVEAVLAGIRATTAPREIGDLLAGASAAETAFRPAPGEWSIVEVLRHLGDIEEHRQRRFDKMLAEDNPLLDRPALPPGDRDSEDPQVLFRRWQGLCARALERLEAMTEAEWRRVGRQTPNPTGTRRDHSPTTVLNQAGRIVEHGEAHLGQIRANLAAARG